MPDVLGVMPDGLCLWPLHSGIDQDDLLDYVTLRGLTSFPLGDVWLAERAPLRRQRHDIPTPPALTDASARARFYEGMAQLLLAVLGRSTPGIFFLDDAHYADEVSLDLLAYLVRRLRGRPLLIVMAWRDADVAPDHRLRQMLAEAQHVNLGTAMSLSPLKEAHVAQLL